MHSLAMFTEDHDENTFRLMEMLHDDLFGGASNISKNHFMQVKGDSQHENAFWEVVSQFAAEKLSMKKVHLTAVENLGKCKTECGSSTSTQGVVGNEIVETMIFLFTLQITLSLCMWTDSRESTKLLHPQHGCRFQTVSTLN